MPFQTSVLVEPVPGFEGGWASINPHTSMLNPNNGDPAISGYSSWKVGAGGLTVGRFAFADTVTGLVTSVGIVSATVRVGFVHRFQPVLIAGYLSQAGNSLYAGQEVDIADGGDFWVRLAAGSSPGTKLFATLADGSAVTGAPGGAVAGAIETRWFVDSFAPAGGVVKMSTRG